jgi:formamidopyrimidine-DNA glycosylase
MEEFRSVLALRNHTLKRALTDPHLFSGIGNAYSDEILHAARLSPVALTQKLSAEAVERLFHATQRTLIHWIEVLRREASGAFPEKVTAFRPDMAVHGEFGKPCPVCGAKVQRIRYADNKTNYYPETPSDRDTPENGRRDAPRTCNPFGDCRGAAQLNRFCEPKDWTGVGLDT